jgi:DegV family protein with EDD domain
MHKIAIITDSDSSLPAALAAQYGIRQVPITIHFDSESFTSGLDIDDRLLFEKIDRLNKLPTTAAPSPAAFQQEYEEAFAAGAQSILAICVSSQISSTYNSAVSAREAFPGREIQVIDSLNVSMAQGFLAILAAEAAQEGKSLAEIQALVISAIARLRLYAVLSTLKYLALGGRVGKFAAGMADTLNIKPILTMKEGKLVLMERVRTRKKAVGRMLEVLKQSLDGKKMERLAIIHVNNPQGAVDLEKDLRTLLPCPASILAVEFTPGLSVHAGNGVVGLVALAES